MSPELLTLFFALDFKKEELQATFNKEQLLEFYVHGCELRLRMEKKLKNFNEFNKVSGISLGKIISSKYHLAKQLNLLKLALDGIGYKGIEEDEFIMLNN